MRHRDKHKTVFFHYPQLEKIRTNGTQAFSGDFQQVYEKMYAKITLDVQQCLMCIFLFLKCYNFIKGNVCIYIVFLTKLRLIVFIPNLLTCSNIYNRTDVSFLKQVNNYVWKNNCPNF